MTSLVTLTKYEFQKNSSKEITEVEKVPNSGWRNPNNEIEGITRKENPPTSASSCRWILAPSNRIMLQNKLGLSHELRVALTLEN